MSHVFISYSKQNKEYADKLAHQLKEQGFEVWIDDRIDYGDSWERAIFKAIDDCLAFVVIMTPQSYDSEWVLRECQYADKRKKPQFPVLLDGEEFPRYGSTQYADVRGGNLLSEAFLQRLEKFAVRKPNGKADVPPAPQKQGKINRIIEGRLKKIPEQTSSIPISPPDLSKLLPAPFEWCEIPAGKVMIEYSDTDHKIFDVPQFWMAKYPITNAQYQVFVDAEDGYRNRAWWEFSDKAKIWRQENGQSKETGFEGDDLPHTPVTWYEAVAFCQWLTATLTLTPSPSPTGFPSVTGRGEQLMIELPTEQQWQRAAQGDDGRQYPWGNEFDKSRCNTYASGIGKPTPVTAYPKGASPYGVMDMSGNEWEWSLTQRDSGKSDVEGSGNRILRGGSFSSPQSNARAAYRYDSHPVYRRYFFVGLRVVSRLPSP